MLWPLVVFAAQSNENQAPGRAMARQATEGQETWNTTDHSKHEALQKEFKSGLEITRACLSCHSEAEAQFHKSIHWTWRADPSDTDKQFGKAGNSLNNFCISTNKTADTSCLACHPGWGTSMESGINCLVCHSQKNMNWDEAMDDIQGFLEEGDDESLEIAKEIYAEAFGRFDELCGPYAPVIDIEPSELPGPSEVRNWTSTQYVDALRHDPACPMYNLNFRQLLHVAYKVAAELGEKYIDALNKHQQTIAKNVAENIYNRHIVPLFLE